MPSAVLVGYARISTADQKAGLEAQIRDLKAAGCEEIYSEEVSSVVATRPQLDASLRYIRKGDVIIVTKLDRLARSVPDLVAIPEALRKKGTTARSA